VLWENVSYVSPNAIRAMVKRQAQGKYARTVRADGKRKLHVAANAPVADELDHVFESDSE
jgi:hypothetical protein